MYESLRGLKIGYALTGSFCTFEKSFAQAKILADAGAELIPIMSENAAGISTRFGTAEENVRRFAKICGREPITDIFSAEPIGPKNLLDIIVVSPCTGNTIAKTALGVTDTPVTMAVKAHLRNNKPVVLAIATNDALGASAKNIGLLHNTNNIYFVPYRQDDPFGKNNSLVCDFSLIPKTVEEALKGRQIQPVIL